MDEKLKKLSLGNIGFGAAVEKFDEELRKVLANIEDINTKATNVREVTLKLKVKPNDERNAFDYEVECCSKLAPVRSFGGVGLLRRVGGQARAYEPNGLQPNMFEDGAAKKDMEVVNGPHSY